MSNPAGSYDRQDPPPAVTLGGSAELRRQSNAALSKEQEGVQYILGCRTRPADARADTSLAGNHVRAEFTSRRSSSGKCRRTLSSLSIASNSLAMRSCRVSFRQSRNARAEVNRASTGGRARRELCALLVSLRSQVSYDGLMAILKTDSNIVEFSGVRAAAANNSRGFGRSDRRV